jgi:hypothetical protein
MVEVIPKVCLDKFVSVKNEAKNDIENFVDEFKTENKDDFVTTDSRFTSHLGFLSFKINPHKTSQIF